MFGTKVSNLDKLEAVLDRQTSIKSLDGLFSAINPKPKNYDHLESVALGIDSSVFLKLATHKKREDILDFLRTRHDAPVVLPGQAVQEYWKNLHSAITTKSKDIKKKFEQLKREVEGLDSGFGTYEKEMEEMLNKFDEEYGYLYDSSTNHNIQSFLELLKDKAHVSYVPRRRFAEISLNRKRSRTPPGFKDDGDGDFYIWAEFLYGVLETKDSGKKFNRLVMLTNDVKLDWSREGIAHPILSSEVQELFGVPFEVWTAKEFGDAIILNS